MQKTLVFSFVFFIFHSFSQINVGSRGIFSNVESAGKLDNDDLDDIKYKPTVLVIPDSQKASLELYREATAGWKLNFIRVITNSELAGYYEKITLNTFMRINWARADRSSYFQLEYIMPYESNGKIKEKMLAMIELNPKDSTSSMAWRISPEQSEKSFGPLINEVFTFHNFTPAHLKIYLSFISAQLTAKKTHWLYTENQLSPDEELVKQLANDTLFIADYAFPFNKKVSEADVLKERKAFVQEYKYKTKFIDPAEFEERVMHAARPTFVLICQNIGNVPKLNIFEAKTGKLVYSGAHINWGLSSGVNEKHMRQISKKIEKAVKN
jgi:hypothetical protein